MCSLLLTVLMLAVGGPDRKPQPDQKPREVHEKVVVSRVVITGHVVDRFAKPIPGLTAADFRLRVDGQDTSIESVEWIPAPRETEGIPVVASSAEPVQGKKTVPVGNGGRLVVLLFQWEIAGQKDVGFVRMMREAKRFVENSDPRDWFAVLGFGSSLRLLQDFTTDHAAVNEAILKIRNTGWHGVREEADGPTVTSQIASCGRSDSIEAGLQCIGTSLQHLPGPKTVLFFGWTAATTRDMWRLHYASVIDAMGKAEASVFSLDVSNGRRYGNKLLLASFATLAFETGGLYHATYDFPGLARQRVQNALEGYYELVFRPTAERGWHEIQVELVTHTGTPLFRRWYRD